jgi:hypothetical protein
MARIRNKRKTRLGQGYLKIMTPLMAYTEMGYYSNGS